VNLEPISLPPLDNPANAGQGEAAFVPTSIRQRLRQQLEPTYEWAAQRYGIHWA